jgi:hypothetical protein
MRTVPSLFLSLHPQDFNLIQDITQHIWRVRSVRFDVHHIFLRLVELLETRSVNRRDGLLPIQVSFYTWYKHISPYILFPVSRKWPNARDCLEEAFSSEPAEASATNERELFLRER